MFSKLVNDSFKYGVGSVIIKFFSILIIPIFAKNFTTTEFGEINTVITFIGLFTSISVLGLDSAAGFFFYKDKENHRRYYLGVAYLIRISVSIFFVFLICFFSRQLAGTNFLLKSSDKYILMIVGVAIIPFDNTVAFFNDLARFLIKPFLYNIINISKILIYFICILVAMKIHFTVTNVLLSLLISSVVPSFVLFFIYRKHLSFRYEQKFAKELLKYGLPLMPVSIMFWVQNSISRLILNNYYSLSETGIFSMMVSISGIFMLITGSIQTAWGSRAMIISNQENAKKAYSDVLRYLVVIIVPLAFLFWSMSDTAILLFSTSEYLAGSNAVILLVLQNVLQLLYSIVSVGLTLTKKTIQITIGYFLSSILSLILSFVLCRTFGIIGVATASFIGNFISFIYIFYRSQKVYYVKYKIKALTIYSISVISVISLLIIFDNGNIFHHFIIRSLIGFCFIAEAFVLKLVTFSDLKQIFEKVRPVQGSRPGVQ